MSQPYNIRFGSGITIGHGVTAGAGGGGGPAPGDITITFTEFDYPSGPPVMGSLEDFTATVSGTGITINNSTKSGVAMRGLTSANLTFVAANLPDSTPGGSGEIWTAHWSSGSTYSTTPVAIYYSTTGFGGVPSIVYWILDPADGTYNTGTAGTFNWPMTLTAGTTTTSFQQ
jgi:hypothetical protein